MGRALTEHYSLIFATNRLRTPISFARDVYANGKLSELSSFVVWETLHRLHLVPAGAYLTFTAGQPMVLGAAGVAGGQALAGLQVIRTFAALGLQARQCEQTWKLVHLNQDRGLLGCWYPQDCDLYASNGEGLRLLHRFPAPIKAIFVSRHHTVFVCIRGAVYRRPQSASSFDRVLELSSAESFFRHNNGMTETTGGTLVIGEYGNVWGRSGWKKLAYLYYSSDDGLSWTSSDFLIRQGANKHVHSIVHSRLLNRLLVADGDNHKKLWISDPLPDGCAGEQRWTAANRFHIQMGGYTSMIEANGKLFFGTDYQGGTNFIVESSDGRKFAKLMLPDPYRRSPIDNMVSRRSARGTEIWANLPHSSGASKCLLMFSRDAGATWIRVLEYARRDHVVWLLSSSREAADELYFSIESREDHNRVVYRVGDME